MPFAESKWLTKIKVVPLRAPLYFWAPLGAASIVLALLIASARRKRSAGRRK
jgi:hypothetical protein